MDINVEVSTQLSLIDVLLCNLDKTIPPCANKKNAKKEEEAQDAMPDSTTNTEKNNTISFHCGDDVLVPNKDGRYYLGTIVELSTNNDNDSCEVGTGVARCLVKFGDGTHAWAPVATLKLLSQPFDDGRIMCVVCKQREGPASNMATNAIIVCDMCGRGYHGKCHTPPVESWINGASWHCKRCVEQRYRVAAAENRASKRSEVFRFKGGEKIQQQELTPPCDTASTTSSAASDGGKEQDEANCYCGENHDWLAQMLLCCRCTRWFHQRCVSCLQYPLYAGDKFYIFACMDCNGGTEYLRRLELCWLDLAHLALYNLTTYNAPNYFDLDDIIMPYIMDNWHALQLPEKMWRTPVNERREKILTALTSSRKRFKCGREMKKRATIWGLRLRRAPPPTLPKHLSGLEKIKKGVPLTDALVHEYAPRLRLLSRPPSPENVPAIDDSLQPSSSNSEKSSYKQMIVPVDGHWLFLMMGKRFHINLNSNSNSENDSTSSYESTKPTEIDEQPTSLVCTSTPRKSDAKDDELVKTTKTNGTESNEAKSKLVDPVPSIDTSLVSCSMKLETISKTNRHLDDISKNKNNEDTLNIATHSTRIATMNLELSKLSTKNIIEHSKIMSLQHMGRLPAYTYPFSHEIESSGDETSSRGTLDAIIPPLKDFQGKNNPFLMQNTKKPFPATNSHSKQNGKNNSFQSRLSLPVQLGPMVKPLKRKLSEKDLVIGPNGEIKRRKFRRPRKYLQMQLNKSCPLPDESNKSAKTQNGNADATAPSGRPVNPVQLHGRRLRQRQEKNYYENGRRNTNNAANNNSVKSLQLSPHKTNSKVTEVNAEQLKSLKSSVQSYFRAGQTFHVLAKRNVAGVAPAYLIEWDSSNAS